MVAIDEQTASHLLDLARASLIRFVQRHELYRVSWQSLPSLLQQQGASFVTLMNDGHLRGCIGSTKAELPLAYDIIRNTVAAARDPRFQPVSAVELPDIRIGVSVLDHPQPLPYEDEADLCRKLRPGVDGVILTWRGRHGLLLPQVWERIPDPGQFLKILCQKAEIPWRAIHDLPPSVAVLTFETNNFEEDGYHVEQ